MSSSGALIPPELEAQVHWTIGRASGEAAEKAVVYGSELIAKVQQALERAFHNGAEAERRNRGTFSGASTAGLPEANGRHHRDDWSEGAVV